MYALDDYDFDLPEDQIAQQPIQQRDHSRLLTLNRWNGKRTHRTFKDLTELLLPSDVIVVNNTQVIPGRLTGYKETGGKVDVLLLNFDPDHVEASNGELQCLIKASKQLKPGSRFTIAEVLTGCVIGFEQGVYTVQFQWSGDFDTLLNRHGQIPLPPYIKRQSGKGATINDKETYQTVYAAQKGAIAAPTAGLHFTEDMLAAIRSRGVQIVTITLHIGYGTFLPVRVDDIRRHKMHSERFKVTQEAAETINRAKEQGHRIIAVGTTTVRTLEYLAQKEPCLTATHGSCGLFIYPGFRFQIVDGMITNFHLPKSSLMMLVSAFAGRESIISAYREAVAAKYRFFSYGDAMFIHP